MDFADEPYVRLYTRRTLTWKRLGWEGRAVRNAMLDGEFDAAGIFDTQGGDPAECISVATDLPIEIVRVGLERLAATKTWVVTDQAVIWPNYEEAQNCKRSDRLRQRDSRRARSAQAVTDVTTGHGESQPVTGCHSPSHPPILPEKTTPGACARRANPQPSQPSSPEPITEIRAVGSGGVAKTYSIRGLPAPQSYLDAALMAGVGREQAAATWTHYATQGLPPNGVEDLEPWMVLQAKGFKERRAKAAPRPPAGPPPPPKGMPAAQGIAEWQAEEARLAALADAERDRRQGGTR